MELKTLKDLQGLSFRGECKLRQEAIKWIKHLKERVRKAERMKNGICVTEGFKLMDLLTETRHKIAWIQKFFNITDEELK